MDEATSRHMDAEMDDIVGQEQRAFTRVMKHLAGRKRSSRQAIDYDGELVTLRDQISEARLEDVPALVAQMERLQQVAARRAEVIEGQVDEASPYFGRMVLEEGGRRREVLIGRSTYLDPKTGIQIVDWRDAPVSRVYYRYEEGDDYDENFGGREVEGEVAVRRSVAISSARLRRIGSVQGTFVCARDDSWRRMGTGTELRGGQGAAPRPADYKPVGKLGIEGLSDGREDKYLPEIASLIDPRQFELITKPESGLVVVQGGAGSGKTTIGLHRMAYLAFQQPKRFQAARMQILVFNDALARYISHVLPALGVPGVPVMTLHTWARKQRIVHAQTLPRKYTDETPDVVVRLKKHPAWLAIIDERVASMEAALLAALTPDIAGQPGAEVVERSLQATEGKALWQRLAALKRAVGDTQRGASAGVRHAVEREAARLQERLDPVAVWAEMLCDRPQLQAAFDKHAPGEFTPGQIGQAFNWCTERCGRILGDIEDREDGGQALREARELDSAVGADGRDEYSSTGLDWEDDVLVLRLFQRLRGPLKRKGQALLYEHMFVDEAQDLSPLEMGVVLGTVNAQSITLAGDVAQRLMMDNGFSSWSNVMGHLGLSHVEIEPLRISYRSTYQIMELANSVLGPLANEVPGEAQRQGTPVELFQFAHTGDAVGFLAESLRGLALSEPMASVAVITRTTEQAADYAEGLTRAEVPNVRYIAEQDFPFKAGIDVVDVRQVKGLEFDYVVLTEVTGASYPDSEEARHLLHIAATRAAHQLWITTTETPSPLLPRALVERGY